MNSCDCIMNYEGKYRLEITTGLVKNDGAGILFTYMPISAKKNHKPVSLLPNYCALCGAKHPNLPKPAPEETAAGTPVEKQ